jgi:hypothetical protein
MFTPSLSNGAFLLQHSQMPLVRLSAQAFTSGQLNEALKAFTALPPTPAQKRKRISLCAYIFLVVVTVIWGDGDLWF